MQASCFRILTLGFLLTGFLYWAGCQPATHLSREKLLDNAEKDLDAGNFHKAMVELQEALNQDPQNIQVHLDLGWVALYTNQLDKAKKELQYVEQIQPSNSEAQHLRGAMLEKGEQWVDALSAYNEALKGEINDPQLHADIARVFLKLNQPDASVKEYGISLRLNPQNSGYHFGQCLAYRQLKQYLQATSACQKALQYSNDPTEKDQIQEIIETIKLLQGLEVKRPLTQ